jgi:hypothetical protein
LGDYVSSAKSTNPIYYLVAVLGIVFTISACAYGVMSIRAARGGDVYGREADTGLMRLMRERGGVILGIEIAALAAASIAAMAADSRAAKASNEHDKPPSLS